MSDSAAALANLISVIVPTCNRATKLQQCLSALLAANLPEGVGCEIICVDNRSSDDTRLVVERLMTGTSPIQLKYVFEARQGASSARNAGLREARGAIIAMTDDDCIVDRDWLVSIWREFEAAPEVSLLGGRVELYDANDLPMTIRTSRERRTLTPEMAFNIIPSCNIAVRRTVVNVVGLFDINFGPGTALAAGEDTDFVHRAAIAGFVILYSPDVLVYHAHGRRTEVDRRKLEIGYFKGRGAVYVKHILKVDSVALRVAYWEIANLIKGIFLNVTERRPAKRELWVLRLLIAGGFLYMEMRIRQVVANIYLARAR